VSARVHPGEHVDLLDVEQALGLVDRDLGLDWLSPSTRTILCLPRTPPFSFTRSTIILAPRQQFSEPAAEKGPVWSKRVPILIVEACAWARSTQGPTALPAAAAPVVARNWRREMAPIVCPPRR
jgi:hypothetical protein